MVGKRSSRGYHRQQGEMQGCSPYPGSMAHTRSSTIGRLRSATWKKATRGDAVFVALVVMMLAAFFSLAMVTLSWQTSIAAKRHERDTVAQEAVDIALSQALYDLNQNYGVATVDGYLSSKGAYNRTLPTATSPQTSDLTQFNATRQTSLHRVVNGAYGVQAEARWWVDVYPVSLNWFSSAAANKPARAANKVGDLYVEARLVSSDGAVVSGYRAIRVPLYQIQARAVRASTDGKGLSYVVSPLSMFQFGAFGTQGVRDVLPDGNVKLFTPVGSSGDVVLDDPGASVTPATSSSMQTKQRFESAMTLFGKGKCRDYDTAAGTSADCVGTSAQHQGFEIQPDTVLLDQMLTFCGTQGLDDFVASEQRTPSLVASDTTYCFRNFTMDRDVRLVPGSSERAVRIFVQGTVTIADGALFVDQSGASLSTQAATGPQAVIYTPSTAVSVGGVITASANRAFQSLYLYAPYATCSPGRMTDNPATAGVDESTLRSSMDFVGSIVCRNVVLDYADSIINVPPSPEIVEFGEAGFGSDLYPSNLWFLDEGSMEFVPRQEW